MDFKVTGRSIWLTTLCLVTGLASIAVGQDATSPIDVQLYFTRGLFGETRSEQFLYGEDPEIVAWITGLNARPEDHGAIHLNAKFLVRDSSGKVLSEASVESDRYEMLGPGAIRCSCSLKLEGKPAADEALVVIFEGEHIETGERFSATRKMYFRPVEGLSILQYSLYHSPIDIDRPAGHFLQAGTDYHLRLEVEGIEVQAGEARTRVTLVGCDVGGNPVTAKTAALERSFPVPPNQSVTLNLNAEFMPNYTGEFLLRTVIEDLNSGQAATKYIPISVVSGHEHPVVKPKQGELHVELQPTVGTAGLPRQNDVYDEAEIVFVDISITGLKGDAEGKGHVIVRNKLIDGDGEEIVNYQTDPIMYVQHLGGETCIVNFHSIIKKRKGIARTAQWTLEVEDVESGATGSCTMPVRIEPQPGLRTKSLRLTLDKEGNLPAGCVMYVGRTYYVHGEAVGGTMKDQRVDLEMELNGVDRDGKPYSNHSLKFDETVHLSRYTQRAPDEVKFVHEFKLNRSGDHALRVLVRDKHTGEESYQDIPVSVVGYGPNDPPSKAR